MPRGQESFDEPPQNLDRPRSIADLSDREESSPSTRENSRRSRAAPRAGGLPDDFERVVERRSNNNLKRSSVVVVRRERSERFPVNDCRSVAGSARRGFAGWDARRIAGRAPRCCSGIRSAGVRFICRRMPESVQEESGRGYARDPRTALRLSSNAKGRNCLRSLVTA